MEVVASERRERACARKTKHIVGAKGVRVERRRWSNGEARVEEQVEGGRALYQEGKALVRKG